jgi:probable HAF family extracellular repeat protein
MVGLGDFPGGGSTSLARAVSADGTTIVGRGQTSVGSEAFRWTAAGGMVGIGDLPGGPTLSEAFGVSADGTVVVGESSSAAGDQAFRWTMEGGMVGLGDLPGGHFESAAYATSADGSVVVGTSYTDLGFEAFYWNASTGMVNLREMLIAGGVTGLSGWQLSTATSISADGRTIVGWGENPNGQTEGWIATVPEPSTVYLAICGSLLLVGAARRRRKAKSVGC